MRLGVADLTHAFPGHPPLFDGLSFGVEPGSLVGLVGPSGSGKSTLLSILGGYLTPSSGAVVAEGVGRIGWVYQNPVGAPRRSALDHVSYPLIAAGVPRRSADAEAREIMARFRLAGLEDSPFRALSGGEAQRLMLARAVACRFDALLIDEPTAQLDPRNATTVVDVVAQTASADRITIVATHDGRLVERCDRVLDLAAL